MFAEELVGPANQRAGDRWSPTEVICSGSDKYYDFRDDKQQAGTGEKRNGENGV